MAQSPPSPTREIQAGISSSLPTPGLPYELLGKRIVFTNWYYVDPGDLDWHDAAGKSVYVDGSAGPFEAHHIAIRAPRGVQILAHKPTVLPPFDRPHRMIVHDGDRYKAWTNTEYFESNDAIHWEKKVSLQLAENCPDGLYQVFIDSSAPPTERYKAVWTGSITRAQFDAFRAERPNDWEPKALFHLGEQDQIACLFGGTSGDGVTWKTLPQPLVVEYCDTWNTAYYDAARREYVLYTRHWSVGPRSERLPPDIRNSWTGVGRRAIGRTSSRDFHQFAPSEMILEPAPEMLPSEQLYTNCRTSVPGAPDQHLMFPTIWNASIDDSTRIALASSHDGRVWNWVPGGDLLRTEPFGRWNGGCIWGTPELIELPNGDWALPYLAHNLPHKYPRGQMVGSTSYAIWPKGRLVGLQAVNRGEFTMIPIIPPGKVLKINAITSRPGYVKIEVVGSDGRSLTDCQPIVGDQHWSQVTWKSAVDLGVEPPQSVTLRFELQQAQVFGLQFE